MHREASPGLTLMLGVILELRAATLRMKTSRMFETKERPLVTPKYVKETLTIQHEGHDQCTWSSYLGIAITRTQIFSAGQKRCPEK